MKANDIIRDARVESVRVLKAEASRLKAELASLSNRVQAWENHFAQAVLAARDADRLPDGGSLVIVDGWNFELGFRGRGAAGRDRRVRATAAAERWAAAHPLDFVWTVFDGPRENAEEKGRLRVSFTGGAGAHRADRAICDYIHMMRMTGRAARVLVVTDDRDFAERAETLGARTMRAAAFDAEACDERALCVPGTEPNPDGRMKGWGT